jgi:UDP-N-acetylmuramoyl-tripeptide--D-alanyl-D-alanine ligase
MYSWVSLSHIQQWTGGKTHGQWEGKLPVSIISTDSRTLERGQVFVALRGEKFDANAFIPQAIEKGAAALIVEKAPANCPIPCLEVEDTLIALISIGESLRDSFKGTVIGITGSAGKSSTKEMIGALLGDDVVRSPASFNNLLGVAKTLSLVQDGTKSLVLEMGMNAFGEIKELCTRFKPHFGLLTNIGDAHIGKLGGKEGIFKAKKELFDYLASSKTSQGIALNLDDSLVVKAFEQTLSGKLPAITYSTQSPKADVQVLNESLDPATGYLNLELRIREEKLKANIPIFGKHHSQNIAAATAAATLMGVTMEELSHRLTKIQPASHRGEVTSLSEDRVLIDESYNCNPSALTSALTTLNEMDQRKRRILVIGEMKELGEFSDSLHREVGETIVRLYQDRKAPFLLIGVGKGTAPLVDVVKKALPAIPWFQVNDVKEAITHAQALFRPNDILFVKGSRSVALDVLVDSFLKIYSKTPVK